MKQTEKVCSRTFFSCEICLDERVPRHSHLRSKYIRTRPTNQIEDLELVPGTLAFARLRHARLTLCEAQYHCEAISLAAGEYHCVKGTFTLTVLKVYILCAV